MSAAAEIIGDPSDEASGQMAGGVEMSGTNDGMASQIPIHCFDCYHGRYELVTRDEEYPMTDGSRMVLPRVNYLRCMECGEELLTSESDHYIQEYGPPQVDIQALWEEHELKTASDGPRCTATILPSPTDH